MHIHWLNLLNEKNKGNIDEAHKENLIKFKHDILQQRFKHIPWSTNAYNQAIADECYDLAIDAIKWSETGIEIFKVLEKIMSSYQMVTS